MTISLTGTCNSCGGRGCRGDGVACSACAGSGEITITERELRSMGSQQRESKYHNERSEVDGVSFDSKREGKRWVELQQLQRAGEIIELQRQVSFRLEVNGILIATYRADFVYRERDRAGCWVRIVEDSKGMKTREYLIKRKLMLAIHGIEIRET